MNYLGIYQFIKNWVIFLIPSPVEIAQSQNGNKNAFNLILIDRTVSLLYEKNKTKKMKSNLIISIVWVYFRNLLNDSVIHTFHLHQYLLIVVTHSVQNASESLDNIVKLLMYYDVLNVNVLIKDVDLWSLYYYKPYVKRCYSFEIEQITIFTPDNYNECAEHFVH